MTAFQSEMVAGLQGPEPPMIWLVLTVVLGLSGPLGTGENCPLAQRTLFWSVTLGVVIVMNAVLRGVLHGVLGWQRGHRILPLVAASVALLVAAPVHAVAQGQVVAPNPILTSSAVETLVFLFLTALGIGGHSYLADTRAAVDRTATPENQAGPVQEIPLPRLVQRLDPPLRGHLMSIMGRDHYVDIRTTAGQASILMRFVDAVAEAAPQDGAQVHRSHWVAWDAVTGVERDAGRVFLCVGGARVPVSRAKRPLLAERGLI